MIAYVYMQKHMFITLCVSVPSSSRPFSLTSVPVCGLFLDPAAAIVVAA